MSLSSTLTLTPTEAASGEAVVASLPSQQSLSLSAPEQTPPFEIHSSQPQEGEATPPPPPVLRRMGAFVAATPSWPSTSSLSIYDDDVDDEEEAGADKKKA
jgi:hypothetical protein